MATGRTDQHNWVALRGGSLCVLLLEEDELLRGALARVLRGNCMVIAVADCDQANAALARARVDVLVADSGLAQLDERCLLLAELRRLWPSVRIVLLSGDVPGELARACRERFAVDQILDKPFTAEQLVQAVHGGPRRHPTSA